MCLPHAHCMHSQELICHYLYVFPLYRVVIIIVLTKTTSVHRAFFSEN